MKIKTGQLNPPVPTKSFDWVAYLDGNENYCDHGATEQEAIKKLKDRIESDLADVEESKISKY